MKKYIVNKIGHITNLIDDEGNIIMSSSEFENNEIVTENDIIIKECNYIDDEYDGTQVGKIAYRK